MLYSGSRLNEVHPIGKLRQEFWEIIQKFDLNNLVFLDESGVNIGMTRLSARALIGKKAHAYRPDKRGKNVTMIGALSLKGIIAAMTFKGGNDQLAFKTYVQKVLVPNLWAGACVVMDNFSSHKVVGIKETIESVGAHLIYLSSYSSEFSQEKKIVSLKSKNSYVLASARTYKDFMFQLDALQLILRQQWESIPKLSRVSD